MKESLSTLGIILFLSLLIKPPVHLAQLRGDHDFGRAFVRARVRVARQMMALVENLH